MNAESIRERYAPFGADGKILPPEVIADRIVDWSIYFLGDKALKDDLHYHIRDEVPVCHRLIYRDLAQAFKRYYITVSSEFGKTTIATLVYPLYQVYNFNEPYTILSSRVQDTAKERLDEIKHEVEYNPKLIEVYGQFKGERKLAWAADYIELANGSKIKAVGVGGNVRGRKRGGYRPTLFLLDDPEEVADIRSEAILREHIDWLFRSVVPRLDKDYGKVRVIGTLIGLNGTIDTIRKDPRWIGKDYKAVVDNPDKPDEESVLPIEKRKSVWEARFSTEFLQKERLAYMKAGRLNDWMFERMNEPIATLVKNLKGYKFFHGSFERKNEQNLLHLEGHLDPIPVYTYITIDPAFSQAASADERALVTFAMGKLPVSDTYQKTCIWVLEYDFNFMDPDEIIERAIDLHKKYFYRELIIETVAGQKIYEFIATKRIAGDNFLINHPLSTQFVNYQPKSKEDRIYTYFKTTCNLGQLHIRPDMDNLRSELDLFLQCKHLHLLDALEMGCRFAVPCIDTVNHRSPKSRYVQRQKALQDEEQTWRDW